MLEKRVYKYFAGNQSQEDKMPTMSWCSYYKYQK